MQYTATFKGRMVQATYELINNEIVVSGVKVMTEGGWEEQTGGQGRTDRMTARRRICVLLREFH